MRHEPGDAGSVNRAGWRWHRCLDGALGGTVDQSLDGTLGRTVSRTLGRIVSRAIDRGIGRAGRGDTDCGGLGRARRVGRADRRATDADGDRRDHSAEVEREGDG